MSTQDGGPAFPINTANRYSPGGHSYEPGMSLRDWFAGMALQGILAADAEGAVNAKDAARISYMYADATLAERRKEERP